MPVVLMRFGDGGGGGGRRGVRPEIVLGSSYLKCVDGEHLRPTFYVLQPPCRYG